MILIKPEGNDGTALEILRAAAEQFKRAILELEAIREGPPSGSDKNVSEIGKSARSLAEATRIYFTEKQKIENNIKKQRGIVYDFAINFEGAREEIRRRMASLRGAADPEKVSE